jgi:hypothetical protein
VAIDRQLDRLCGNVLEARQQLGPSEDVAQLPAEERMPFGLMPF